MSPRYRMPAGDQDLDHLLLDPTRLAIVSLLASTEWCEFGFVRDSVELTDPALSKQVATLSKAGYIEVRKGYVGKTPRTWLRVTPHARARLKRHIRALQAIAERAETAGAHHRAQRPTPEEAAPPPRSTESAR